MTMMRNLDKPDGVTVVWSADNDDGDGPAWIANLVFEQPDGVTLYRNIGETSDYQSACRIAMDAWNLRGTE